MEEIRLTPFENKRIRHRAGRRLTSTSVSADVLLELLFVGVATYRGVSCWPFTTVASEQDRARRELYREYVRQEQQALLRLKRRRLVEAIRVGNQIEYMLTKDGEIEALRQRILHTDERLPSGDYCMVSFDVPRRANSQRDFLRYFLKRAGFTLVHQSLWKSDKAVEAPLKRLIELCNLQQAVSIFVTQLPSQ